MKIPGKWWEKKTTPAENAEPSTPVEKDANMDKGAMAAADSGENVGAGVAANVAAGVGSHLVVYKDANHRDGGKAEPGTTNVALGGAGTLGASGTAASAATAGASAAPGGPITSAVAPSLAPMAALAEKAGAVGDGAGKVATPVPALAHEKRRALGRGLESLLPGPRGMGGAGVMTQGSGTGTAAAPGTAARDGDASAPVSGVIPELHAQAMVRKTAEGHAVVDVALDRIDPNPHQTRSFPPRDLPELQEMADSIGVHGVVQPITVRPGKDGRYILISGERRVRASKLAEKTTVPAIVRVVSDQQAAEMTVIENLQREDLNCMDQARAYIMLSQNFGLTQEQIGQRVGTSRESVSNYMRLVKLPEQVQHYLKSGQLDFSHARVLLNLKDPDVVTKVAHKAAHENMSVEKLEHFVLFDSSMTGVARETPKRGARWVDPNVRAAERDLERILGVKVRIRDRKGKGKITLEYSTLEDFDRVVGMLKGKK
jgi:ParB family chromosome partitioning protein